MGAGTGQQVAELGRGGGPAGAHDGTQAGDPGPVASSAARLGGRGSAVRQHGDRCHVPDPPS